MTIGCMEKADQLAEQMSYFAATLSRETRIDAAEKTKLLEQMDALRHDLVRLVYEEQQRMAPERREIWDDYQRKHYNIKAEA